MGRPMYGKQPYRRFRVSTARIAAVAILAVAVGMLSDPVLARGTASGIDFQFLDSATGFGVPSATVKWARIGKDSISPLSHSAVSSSEGKLPLQLSPGQYALEFSAPGYKPMRGHYSAPLGSMTRLNVVLDPVVPPKELRNSTVDAELRKGMELDHGFVSDALTHLPIANVEVRLKQSGATATTNSRGYFKMMAPAQDLSKLTSPSEFPPPDTLTASAPGYKTYILTGVWHNPDSWARVKIQLTLGTGTTHEDATPVPLMPPATVRSLGTQQPGPTKSLPEFLLRWLSGSARGS